LIRGASPLGLSYTLSRLRFALRCVRVAHSLRPVPPKRSREGRRDSLRSSRAVPSPAARHKFRNWCQIGIAVLALFTPLVGFPLQWYIPAVVSLGFLANLWWAGELRRAQQVIVVAWFFIALAIQIASRDAWMWIAGFVAQVALAIALVFKKQIDDIY